jgi:hypothetical protein
LVLFTKTLADRAYPYQLGKITHLKAMKTAPEIIILNKLFAILSCQIFWPATWQFVIGRY